MSRDPAVVAARAQVVAARARLDRSVASAKRRLSPRALAGDAVESARSSVIDAAETGIQAVRERPATTAAVVGAVALALARKPIFGWIASLRRDDDATVADDAS